MDESKDDWYDAAKAEKGIRALVETMQAYPEINYIEWMQALRSVHAAMRAQVEANAAELVESRLEKQHDENPAGRDSDEDADD